MFQKCSGTFQYRYTLLKIRVTTIINKKVDWIIVGAMTGKYRKKYSPEMEWIENITEYALSNNIPIYQKHNLPISNFIQQFPL